MIIGLTGDIKSSSKYVTRVCDLCGRHDQVRAHSVYVNRRRRGTVKDLCRSCGTKEFYRENPQPVGRNSPRWRGGLNAGYQIVYWRDPETGKPCKEREHRLILAKHLDRTLKKTEIVHHLDMVKTNNDLSNLFLCTSEQQHQYVHASMEQCGFELFGKKIWFNSETNEYTLIRCKPIRIKMEVRIDQKVHIRKYGNLEYERCWCPIAKRERMRHVLIIEQVVGRRLFRNEVVHHVDGNTLNNAENNLWLMTISQHLKAHKSMQQCAAVLYAVGEVIFEDGQYIAKIMRS